MSKCKGCGAEIKWIKMISGKNMPVDTKPEKRIILHVNGVEDVSGEMVDTYMPHWGTCSKAKDFKK